MSTIHNRRMPVRRKPAIGFFLGLAFFAAIMFLPPLPSLVSSAQSLIASGSGLMEAADLAFSMKVVLALLVLMVVWWITEPIPLAVTALLPAVILPLFHVTGVQGASVHEFTLKNSLLSYANPVIYLFFGGFLIAAAMQKWHLDRRITLWLLTRGRLAQSPSLILLAMMTVTAFLSMWISNTACTAMMLPLGLGVLRSMNLEPGKSNYGTCVMLGIAWAASIGGVGTIIGTPPNGIALGILNNTFGADPEFRRISFLDWMSIGVPYVILYVPVAWGIVRLMNPPEVSSAGPEIRTIFLAERAALGPMLRGERLTVGVFLGAAALWVSNPFWGMLLPSSAAAALSWVDEYFIGLAAGVVLFLLPVDWTEGTFVLAWKDTRFVDWGTLLLFGGGIALSDAMFRTGVAAWIASSFIGLLGSPSTLVMLFAVVVFMGLLTEVTSNTAVTTMMVPVVIAIARSAGENPITLSVGAAIAASMAFMLPVATPPNALVHGTGFVTVRQMVRSGLVLEVIGWFATVTVVYLFGHVLSGVLNF